MGAAASSWRRLTVEPLLARYAANERVAAVALSGSTARGTADRWSDVEVAVFWNVPPTDDERSAAATDAGAVILRLFEFDVDERVWCDDLAVGPDSLLVEVVHMLDSTAEDYLSALLDDCEPEPLLLNFAQGLLDAVPSHGSERLDAWKSRVSDYPSELQRAVIRRNAQVDHFWRWRAHAERGNSVLLAAAFADTATRIYATILALNKRYGPTLKSPDALTRPLPTAPSDFAGRLQACFSLDPHRQAEVLEALVEETYDLIERECPDVDVARLRHIFRHARTPAGPAESS